VLGIDKIEKEHDALSAKASRIEEEIKSASVETLSDLIVMIRLALLVARDWDPDPDCCHPGRNV
jgi:hypothetical protein